MEDTKKAAVDDGKVELVLLRDGTMFGKKGDIVRVDANTAASLTRVRKDDHGNGQVQEFRLARPSDEIEPPVPMATLTQAEADALGMKNIVVTPKDDILPPGLRGKPEAVIQDAANNVGKPAKEPKAPKVAKAKAEPKAKAAGKKASAKEKAAPAAKVESKPEAGAVPGSGTKINPPENATA